MSSPRQPGSVRRRSNGKPVQRAAQLVGLQGVLDSLERSITLLHEAHPDRVSTVSAWATEMAAAGVVEPGLSATGYVRVLCEWFAAVRDLHLTEREAFDSVHGMDAAERQRVGQKRGRLVAAMRGIDDPEIRGAMEQVLARLEMPELESRPRPGVTLETQLGVTLMSLLLAVGFGAGLDSRFTTRTAARHIVKVAACYGFDLREGSLVTNASRLKKD